MTLRSLAIGLILALAVTPAAPAEVGFLETMEFAANMARKGNWREAKYRWELALERWPKHRKILNNLAVASEALGELDAAREYYVEARAAGKDEATDHNYYRSVRFWRQHNPEAEIDDQEELDAPRRAPKAKGKTLKVTVQLPVPPKLDLEGKKTLLVASFLAPESEMLDINRELVRFLRGEFRKHAALEVLPITPAPAIPEQTLEDLIANGEFWKHLGREYDTDVVVSGAVVYDRRDVSGFRDVDTVSQTTGQKVRRTQFVEQEEFQHALDILFMDARTGELLYRDRLSRKAVFRGSQNDPITAFYDLSESLAPDVLGIVKTRNREDVRFIFKR